MVEVIPAILTNDPQELKEMLARCEEVHSIVSELIDRVSIDIIDGKFADNKTIDPILLADIETNLKIDYQLMVNEPINWVEKCVRGQADRIIGHVEQMSSQVEFVGKVQEAGLSAGLALDLDTPVSDIDSTILTNLDVVLIMGVPAGFGGQKFDPLALPKIASLDKIRKQDALSFKICVDGGVTVDNIGRIRKEGADEVSAGKRLFKGDLKENIDEFIKAAYK